MTSEDSGLTLANFKCTGVQTRLPTRPQLPNTSSSPTFATKYTTIHDRRQYAVQLISVRYAQVSDRVDSRLRSLTCVARLNLNNLSGAARNALEALEAENLIEGLPALEDFDLMALSWDIRVRPLPSRTLRLPLANVVHSDRSTR